MKIESSNMRSNLNVTDGTTSSSVNLATEKLKFVDTATINFVTTSGDEVSAEIIDDSVTSAKINKVVVLTGDADSTLTVSQDTANIIVDVSLTANRTITLPTSNLTPGMSFKITRTDDAAFTSTLDAGSGKTIEGFSAGTWVPAKQSFVCPSLARGTIEVVYATENRWVIKGNCLGYS